MINIPTVRKGYSISKIHGYFLPSFSCFATTYLCRLLQQNSSGWIRNDYSSDGDAHYQKWSQWLGHVVRYHPDTVTRENVRQVLCIMMFVIPVTVEIFYVHGLLMTWSSSFSTRNLMTGMKYHTLRTTCDDVAVITNITHNHENYPLQMSCN
jgi:hypothetical protein